VGNEEPGAASGFLFRGWRFGEGLGEDGDSAGAGTCGEVRRVLVQSVQKRNDGCV